MIASQDRLDYCKKVSSWLEAHGFVCGDMGQWYPDGEEFDEEVCLVKEMPLAVDNFIQLTLNQKAEYPEANEMIVRLDVSAPDSHNIKIVKQVVAIVEATARLNKIVSTPPTQEH